MDAKQPRTLPGGLAPWWFLTMAVFAVHNAEEHLRDLPVPAVPRSGAPP
jgi:hypothetical protein